MEEKAQVSVDYLLIAVFSVILAITAALMVEALRSAALKSQADILSTRAKVIENIFSS